MWYRDCDSGVTGEERGRGRRAAVLLENCKGSTKCVSCRDGLCFSWREYSANLIFVSLFFKSIKDGWRGKANKTGGALLQWGDNEQAAGTKDEAVFTRSNVTVKTDPVPTQPWVNTPIIKTRINYPETVWQIIKLYVKCINLKTVEGHWQLLTYSSQNPSDFAEPSVPPGHAIILRSGFAGRCCLFGAHCALLFFCYGFQTPTGRFHSLKQPNNIQVKFAPGNKTSCRLA